MKTKRVKVRKSIRKVIKIKVNKPKLLSEKIQKDLVRRIRKGDMAAKQKFVEANMGLTYFWAKYYYGVAQKQNLEFMDLVQEGSIGLILAVQNYDPEKGTFSGYAHNCIRNEIRKLLKKTNKDNEISLHVLVGEKKEKELIETIIAPPRSVNIDFEKFLKIISKQIGNTPAECMNDIVAYYTLLEKDDEQAAMGGERYTLSEKEKKEARFVETAKKFNITAERVRQILEVYYSYNKLNENIKYVESAITEELRELSSVKNQIGTLHTTERYGEISKWTNLDSAAKSRSWDDLYQNKDVTELLNDLNEVEFYAGFINYLAYRFKEALPEFDAKEACEEIRVRKEQMPMTDCLVEFLLKELEANGYRRQKKRVKSWVTAKEMKDAEFLELAVELEMELEDVEEFLKKFLFREGLNLFDREELILYIAFKYARGNKSRFIENAKLWYDDAKAEQLFVEEKEFNTTIYKNTVEKYLNNVDEKVNEFDSTRKVLDELKPLFAHVKYMEEKFDYQRTANALFVDAYEILKKLTAKDVDERVKPEKNGDKASGTILVEYDCTEGICIPKGHKFLGKEAVFFASEEVCCESRQSFDVIVNVECTTVGGEVEKRTQFQTTMEHVQGAFNKSKFKCNKGQQRVGGKLVVVYKANNSKTKVIPKGTIFTANGKDYYVVEDTPIISCVEVPVEGDKEGKKNTIVDIDKRELFPQIKGFSNTKISETKESAKREKDKTKRISKQLQGKLERYLYQGSGGNLAIKTTIEAVDKDKKMREKLVWILENKDLSFSNKIRMIEEKKKFEIAVSREDLLTILFLKDMAQQQFAPSEVRIANPKKRLAGRVQEMNKYLNEAGFYGIYPMNPYDCLLLYISTFEDEPLNVYRNLWGIAQDYYAQR